MATQRLVTLGVVEGAQLVPGYLPEITVETSAHLLLGRVAELLRGAYRGRNPRCSVLSRAHGGLALVHSDEIGVN